ncbi:YqaE/Pmp3 family membrane protein [Paenibacillus chibensis]|uniref:YqaE/Pmp3 family membrane protein n=1 Tax=Paenibacillus chibensis TaxID=59846 RepID=A0ABU6PNE6_9BACL|nr:YqaE/Pmp3 family membrane protein [Paenibacillus chibensis]
MRYLLALILPPIAVLLCGKPIQALLNLVLCCLFVIPGIIHALMVVSSHKADKRNNKLIEAIERNNQAIH